MPRKQRFKPSRKPKPVTPSEEIANDRPTGSAPAHNDNSPMREVSHAHDDRSDSVEPESGSR